MPLPSRSSLSNAPKNPEARFEFHFPSPLPPEARAAIAGSLAALALRDIPFARAASGELLGSRELFFTQSRLHEDRVSVSVRPNPKSFSKAIAVDRADVLRFDRSRPMDALILRATRLIAPQKLDELIGQARHGASMTLGARCLSNWAGLFLRSANDTLAGHGLRVAQDHQELQAPTSAGLTLAIEPGAPARAAPKSRM